MPYELQLGARYLFGAGVDRRIMRVALFFLAIACAGFGILIARGGESTLGVVMLFVGVLASVVCALVGVFSVFTGVSVLGVVFGVAMLTVVLAVTTGFQMQFREKVLGVNAHVIVMKQQQTFAEYREVLQTARTIDPEVIAAQPFIFSEMLVTRGKGQLSGVAIKGVDPELVSSVLDLQKHMTVGKVSALSVRPGPGEFPPIILGKELARKLRASVGDTVTVVVPLSNVDFTTWRITASAPRTRKFRVQGIFYSGFDEYDRRLMYAALSDMQELAGRGDEVMGVELKVSNVDRAGKIARKLEQTLGGAPYQVQDWYELNRNLFTALRIQKNVLVIVLTTIILVAAFNMVSALFMLVTKKTKEIAILKAMGARTRSIGYVFQIVGLAIAGAGTLVGVGLGLLICHVIGNYGYHLDPKVYLIDRLPIVIQPFDVGLVVVITTAIGVLITLIPSTAASILRPAVGLRHE